MKQAIKFAVALGLLILMGVGVLIGFLFTIGHAVARMMGAI